MKRSVCESLRKWLAVGATVLSMSLVSCASTSDEEDPLAGLGEEYEETTETNTEANAEPSGELENLVNDSVNNASLEGENSEDPFANEGNGLADSSAEEVVSNTSTEVASAPVGGNEDPFAQNQNVNPFANEASVDSDPFANTSQEAGASDPFVANTSEQGLVENEAISAQSAEDPFANPAPEAANTGSALTEESSTNAISAPVPSQETAQASEDLSQGSPFEAAPTQEDAQAKSSQARTINASVGPGLSGKILPEEGSAMPYYVQPGDTLAGIAAKVYGSGGKWKELADANGIQNPAKIYVGDVIFYTLSSQSRGFAEAYEGSGRGVVTVDTGDTLSSIAQSVYGTASAWRTLWRENAHISNPDILKLGTPVYYKAVEGVAFENEEVLPQVVHQKVLFQEVMM